MGKLIIAAGNKKRLTRNQEAFNKVTAQIEKLRKEITRKQLQLDQAMEMFSATIHPLRLKKAEVQRKIFDIVLGVYRSKRHSKPDQRILKQILKEEMYDILQALTDPPDEELKNAFLELEGESYERVLKREDAQMKEELTQMFEQMNIDIDLSDVEDETQFAEKIAEARQKFLDEEEHRQHQRRTYKKKTASQIEKEKMQQAAEDLKQKNIGTIYRQLAKLFHPDLEQDEKRRAEKEILMKELTTAYQSKNLHELLLLELKWIHKETNHLETLTEEKLAVYLQVLREQAKELELEKYNLSSEPRYQILVEEFGIAVIQAPLKVMVYEKTGLENEIQALEDTILSFHSDTSGNAIKNMIKDAKAAMKEAINEEELYNMILRRR